MTIYIEFILVWLRRKAVTIFWALSGIHVAGIFISMIFCRRLVGVCTYWECVDAMHGYSADQLSKLFDSLIMSLFYYCIEVWGSALQKKCLERIDKFFRRAYRYGYTTKSIKIVWSDRGERQKII